MFVTFLNELNGCPDHERWAIVDRFMGSLPSVPLTEKDTLVHFLFRGDAESVTVPCDANEWNPIEFRMKRVEGTNLWYYTHRFESDARLDYKFVINGTHWIPDPLNPRQVEGGYGLNSELRMPKYAPPPEIEFHPAIPHGTVVGSVVWSENLKNSRTVYVYTPPGYHNSSDRYPVVLFHDGYDYLTLGRAAHVLDYLIARRRIAPVVALFIPPVDRNAEYAGTQMNAFYSFIVDELLPESERSYRIGRTAAERATIGASNSGNISLWLGLHYPETFGNVAAQSSNVVSLVSTGYENSPRLAIRFYLDIGTYDIPQLIPLVKGFADLVASKGYSYLYRRYHEGHSWGNWRAHMGRALEFFFPPRLPGFDKRRRTRGHYKPSRPVHTSP